ncbi:phosphotransferase family protein [Flexivirga alba]|uniref:Phosphotransferase family protein n=1 Tax=Flexivirga alba TaxID=702742 RepID=A0ABW2AEE9_9MICO
MRHGYTNRTDRQGNFVRKAYAGPDAELRQTTEHHALDALRGQFPVPLVTATCAGWLETRFVDGVHGQDLIDAGHARSVLSECGRVLRQLHALDPRQLDLAVTAGDVVQHGDFGPNNLLFDGDSGHVAAVLDWEFSGVGEAIMDIAWCEWIVRMHHPAAVAELSAFFAAYGAKPPWRLRQNAMARRCRWLEDFTNRWDPNGSAVALWQQRTRTVESWHE